MIYEEFGYIDNEKMPNEKRFLRILNFIASKSYNKMDFEEYIFDIKGEL
jgi:thioredoxin-related protein